MRTNLIKDSSCDVMSELDHLSPLKRFEYRKIPLGNFQTVDTKIDKNVNLD